jgi:hypothetical protein
VYYNAAVQYGTKDVKNTTFNWLLINLLSFYSKHCKWLQLINADLLTELVKSPDLVVMQTEFALYALLKLWIFLRLHPNFFGDTDIVNRSNEVMCQSAVYFEGLQSMLQLFMQILSIFSQYLMLLLSRQNSIFINKRGRSFCKTISKPSAAAFNQSSSGYKNNFGR